MKPRRWTYVGDEAEDLFLADLVVCVLRYLVLHLLRPVVVPHLLLGQVSAPPSPHPPDGGERSESIVEPSGYVHTHQTTVSADGGSDGSMTAGSVSRRRQCGFPPVSSLEGPLCRNSERKAPTLRARSPRLHQELQLYVWVAKRRVLDALHHPHPVQVLP